MTAARFAFTFTVNADSIDELGHVNNIRYLEWCLDAASRHWESLTPKHLRERYVWVVLRHEIDYQAPAFLGEELQMETWVSWSKAAQSERCYTLTRPSDGKVLIRGKTRWCLLQAQDHKPIKIPPEILNLFHPNT
ncbi:acyl-CoA thioesterase [Aureitalea marina]|uniref:Thioesterase n=1 Tax=Aureitalea marina TaxID=930804 RepID=A0A2S7KRR9_9FLAO|nr:thioesterase family protein [Aureitalea marina]PQB05253.1 hypothetical protein BST85_10425 [Aureitalea marina]